MPNFTPPSVEFSPHIGCPNGCSFCPQKAIAKAYKGPKFMSFTDFQVMIKKVPKNRTITFSGVSEPFLNPRIMDMAHLVDQLDFPLIINTTLVGAKVQDIIELGKMRNLKNLYVHLPDPNNFQCPNSSDYLKVLEAVFKNVAAATYMNMGRNFQSHGREIDIDQRPTRKIGYCRKLADPEVVVYPNGDVQLCCMDFYFLHTVGNLLREPYQAIIKKIKRHGPYWLCHRCSFFEPIYKIAFHHATKYISRRQ